MFKPVKSHFVPELNGYAYDREVLKYIHEGIQSGKWRCQGGQKYNPKGLTGKGKGRKKQYRKI